MSNIHAFLSGRSGQTRLTLVIDPRFSGGTSSAVARELHRLAPRFDLKVVAIESRMFKGRDLNRTLGLALTELGLEPEWNPRTIRAEIVVLHNPSFLKFDTAFPSRILCESLYVVTHENFLRPGLDEAIPAKEGFDIGLCLGLIEKASTARQRLLCPVSAYNRSGVAEWLSRRENAALARAFRLADFDWFNICDFPLEQPNAAPRDRRGRLSRPSFEKFPDLETMKAHFPEHAESCTILGGDTFLKDPETLPAHWTVYPFGSMPVAEFLRGLDFFVYFTHPRWRESFGRVIAEAIAAGKVVITDPGTAAIFGEAVVASDGEDVDAIIQDFLADPQRYLTFVSRAQAELARFGPEAFDTLVIERIIAGQAAPDRSSDRVTQPATLVRAA